MITVLGEWRFDALECPLDVAHATSVAIRPADVGQTAQMPKRRPRRPAPPPSPSSGHFRRDGAPKNRYPSEREAADAAHLRWVLDKVELDVYRCDICDGWHMGKRFGRD